MGRWLWFIFAALTSAIYVLLFHKFSSTGPWWIILPTIIFGAASLYGEYRLFQKGRVGRTYAVLTGFIVALVAFGGVLFENRWLSISEWIGLALTISGVLLLAA